MSRTYPKWLYIPWVLILFFVAALLTLMDLIFRKESPIGSQ
jgi:hypothetical protein